MTLTLSPSTSIRPLGEEHLRMFRRMTHGENGVTPRMALPKEATAKVELSKVKITCKEAENAAKRFGGRLATLIEAVMDERIMEKIHNFRGGDVIFVDWRDAPQKKGWHHIDRKRGKFTRIGAEHANRLKWHERLYVNPAAIEAIEKKRPLKAYYYRDPKDGGEGKVYLFCGEGSERIAFVRESD